MGHYYFFYFNTNKLRLKLNSNLITKKAKKDLNLFKKFKKLKYYSFVKYTKNSLTKISTQGILKYSKWFYFCKNYKIKNNKNSIGINFNYINPDLYSKSREGFVFNRLRYS